MNYRREGEGPPILMLPGLGCDERLWNGVGERLATRFTVIHPQVWGRGSLHTAARQAVAVLEEIAAPRAALAGLSMGGYIGFECLRHWPERFGAAAFLDTTAFPDDPERVAGRNRVLQLLREGRFDEVVDGLIANVLTPEAAAGEAGERARAMAGAVGPEAYAADVEAILNRGGYEDVLSLLRVPTLFLCGSEDAVTPPEVARQMAVRVPGARLEVVPDAGHLTPLERPKHVAGALDAFFAEALSVPGPPSS